MATTSAPRPRLLLLFIVLAQFTGTSLWFAGNAIMADLQRAYGLAPEALGDLTASVQLGFITGTLVFAVLMVADRFSPSKVFWASSWIAAACNIGVYFLAEGYYGVLLLRFATGFFLAGIYPVGMKIAADWYSTGLGKALGYLVGALVLGTAFPHWLKHQAQSFDWQDILFFTSGLAAAGGLLIGFLVGDGPHRRQGSRFDPRAIQQIFKVKALRQAAFGYFGHMWELYAFWAFVPVFLTYYQGQTGQEFSVSLWSFFIIAIGGLGCVLGGYASLRVGSRRVAYFMLLGSGLCCLLSPLGLSLPPWLLLLFLLLWGFLVTGDSPQFSTLVAQSAPKAYIGSALTLVNSSGFALTIGSIQLLNWAAAQGFQSWMFLLLVPGPVFGLLNDRGH